MLDRKGREIRVGDTLHWMELEAGGVEFLVLGANAHGFEFARAALEPLLPADAVERIADDAARLRSEPTRVLSVQAAADRHAQMVAACFLEEFCRVLATPTLAERYKAFRETVERVVREEAPRARVVTDIGEALFGQQAFLAFIAFPQGWTTTYECPPYYPPEIVEKALRSRIESVAGEIGKAALR